MASINHKKADSPSKTNLSESLCLDMKTAIRKLSACIRQQNAVIVDLQMKVVEQNMTLSEATMRITQMEDTLSNIIVSQDTILNESQTQAPTIDPDDKELVKVLDQVEARVERLRKDAARIEEEKDTLLATLDAIKHSEWMADLDEFERDDVLHSVARVQTRCLTVEATVHTHRDQQQEEALNQVNQYIDLLVVGVKNDPLLAHGRCQAFMSACCSQAPPESSSHHADPIFEAAILGCTVDDQKRIKKRLQGLLDYFSRLNITST